jgi:DNA polymerase III subunit epsilon
MFENLEFCVVDVETTGFCPRKFDRIIEIAAIRLDQSGAILDEYSSLVNPGRDLGRSDIHGIYAQHVLNAPMFDEIVGDVLSLLRGAVFVAQNVLFDKRFFEAEMARTGTTLPEFPSLCTMRLARLVAPDIQGRSLPHLCDYFGIPLESHHCALADATATSRVLVECIQRIGEKPTDLEWRLGIEGPPPNIVRWPMCSPSGRALRREDACSAAAVGSTKLSQLIAQLPIDTTESADIDSFLEMLARVLEDRRITREEINDLLHLAIDSGLNVDDVRAAAQKYMSNLIALAWQDGRVTESERKDLEVVRNLLDVEVTDFRYLMQQGGVGEGLPRIERLPSLNRTIEAGKTICFTGQFCCRVNGQIADRSLAERIAEQNGLVVMPRVTKKLDFLVVADPDSMSRKAQTARNYGIRVIAEPVFWRMMKIEID